MDIDQSGQLEANEVQALLAKDHRWANIEPREDCVKMVRVNSRRLSQCCMLTALCSLPVDE